MKERVRVGMGFDVHRTDPDRPLVLGGVRIEDAPFGLAGHSDADAVLHAVADACLGALALGDIGQHFPDTDPAWKDADSKDLLRHVMGLVEEAGWGVGNVDVTVIAEAPRLSPHIPDMRRSLSDVLRCPYEAASIKATTHEGMGPLGGGEGIAALAVVTLITGDVEAQPAHEGSP